MTVLYHKAGDQIADILAPSYPNATSGIGPLCGTPPTSLSKPNPILKAAIMVVLIQEQLRSRGLES